LKSKLRTIFTPLCIYCLIFAVLLGYGGGQVSIIKGSFYQTSYANYITRDVVRAGCVIGNTDGTGYALTDRQYWFDQTVQLANVSNLVKLHQYMDIAYSCSLLIGWSKTCFVV
jgi:hypothetical protein